MIKITLNEAKILLCFLNFLYSRRGQLPQDKKDILNSDVLTKTQISRAVNNRFILANKVINYKEKGLKNDTNR